MKHLHRVLVNPWVILIGLMVAEVVATFVVTATSIPARLALLAPLMLVVLWVSYAYLVNVKSRASAETEQ